MFASQTMAARGGGAEEEPIIEVAPADAEIDASVEVSFSIAGGD
jgi:hypothetical protein